MKEKMKHPLSIAQCWSFALLVVLVPQADPTASLPCGRNEFQCSSNDGIMKAGEDL